MTIELELTRNYVALIDEVDADLAAHKWYADVRAGTLIYVKRGSGPRNRRTTELLHRIILERMLGRRLLQGKFTDHADGNGLNNTRSNLRLATRAQNNANVRRKKTNRSGYKGVYRKRSKWQARIMVNRQHIDLGSFDTPELAHAAYCEAARKHFGEFARFE